MKTLISLTQRDVSVGSLRRSSIPRRSQIQNQQKLLSKCSLHFKHIISSQIDILWLYVINELFLYLNRENFTDRKF